MTKRRVPPHKRIPAQPGNRLALKHGAKARVLPVLLDAKAQEIYDLLAGDAPLRDGAELPRHDRAVVALLAECLCRLDSISAWISEHGVFDEQQRIRSNVLRHEDRIQARATKLMEQLGMTPAARAKLGVDLARTADLAQAMSEPDPAKRARMLREAGLDE